MHDELTLSPFRRSIAGLRGTVILRRHEDHAARCADAIRHREHPSWSSLRYENHVRQAAHPDRPGGSHDKMAAINAARDEGLQRFEREDA